MSTQPDVSPITSEEVATFDAGLLNDFGGGNVDWWQDYVRSLLEQSDEHYRQHIEARERAYLALSERVGVLEGVLRDIRLEIAADHLGVLEAIENIIEGALTTETDNG